MTSIVASQPTLSPLAGRVVLAGAALACALALAGLAAAASSGAIAPTSRALPAAQQAHHIRVTADAAAAEIVAVAPPTIAPAAVPVTELEFAPELITARRPGALRSR